MRPTISLAMIIKNELKTYLDYLIQSKSVLMKFTLQIQDQRWFYRVVRSLNGEYFGAKVFIHHFDWINDFAAAKLLILSCKTDYVCAETEMTS